MGNFISSKLKYILVLLAAVVLTANLISTRFTLMTKKQEYNNLLAQKRQIELKIADTQHILDESNDDEYIERMAREKLGYAYPGEVMYIDIQSE